MDDKPARTDTLTPGGRKASMERWHGERSQWHRALLLFAMQDASRRSKAAAGRAVGVVEGSIRSWERRQEWAHRMATHANVEQEALDLYRTLYMTDHGTEDLPHVAKRVAVPLGGAGVRVYGEAAEAIQAAEKARQQAVPDALAVVEQAVASKLAERKVEERHAADRHLKLVDASLGLIAQRLKAKDLKVTVRDIPLLLECRDRLVRVVMGVDEGQGHGPVVESARVKHAKEYGKDVLEAMFQDAEELCVILGALVTKRTTDTSSLHVPTDGDAPASPAGA